VQYYFSIPLPAIVFTKYIFPILLFYEAYTLYIYYSIVFILMLLFILFSYVIISTSGTKISLGMNKVLSYLISSVLSRPLLYGLISHFLNSRGENAGQLFLRGVAPAAGTPAADTVSGGDAWVLLYTEDLMWRILLPWETRQSIKVAIFSCQYQVNST